MELLDIDRIDDVDNMALNLATDLEQMQQYVVEIKKDEHGHNGWQG